MALSRYCPAVCLEWLMKATTASVRIGGILASIQTEHLLNTSREHYRCAKLFTLPHVQASDGRQPVHNVVRCLKFRILESQAILYKATWQNTYPYATDMPMTVEVLLSPVMSNWSATGQCRRKSTYNSGTPTSP